MIDGMLAEYEKALRSLYKANPEVAQDESVTTQARRILADLGRKWAKVFAEKAGPLANRTIGQVDKFSKQNLGASLRDMSGGLTIKTFQMPAALYDKVLASTAENVALIKSIPAQFQDRIQGIVLRSIQSGGAGRQEHFRRDPVPESGDSGTRQAYRPGSDEQDHQRHERCADGVGRGEEVRMDSQRRRC